MAKKYTLNDLPAQQQSALKERFPKKDVVVSAITSSGKSPAEVNRNQIEEIRSETPVLDAVTKSNKSKTPVLDAVTAGSMDYSNSPNDFGVLNGQNKTFIGSAINSGGDASKSAYINTVGSIVSGIKNAVGGLTSNAKATGLDYSNSTNDFAVIETDKPKRNTESKAYKSVESAQKSIENKADEYAQKSADEYNDAMSYNFKGKKLLADILVNGTQMMWDAIGSAATGGSSLAFMGARSYGSGASEARARGENDKGQLASGIKSASIEMLTEKMFDGLAGLYGKGIADDVVAKIATKLAKTSAGQNAIKWLASILGEASEEVASDVLNKIADNVLYSIGTLSNKTDALSIADVGYDALVGGIMGGLGGATNIISRPNNNTSQQSTQNGMPNATAQTEASFTTNVADNNRNATEGLKTNNLGTQEITNKQEVQPQVNGEITSDNVIQRDNAPVQTEQNSQAQATDGLGGADIGTLNSDYQNLQMQTPENKFYPQRDSSVRPLDTPMERDGNPVSKSADTIMGARAIDDDTVLKVEELVANGGFDYIRKGNSGVVDNARGTINAKGFDGAYEEYRSAVESGKTSAEIVALGQQLLLDASKSKDEVKLSALLQLYATNSVNSAQAMQAMSILRRLSPEGQLVSIQQSINQLNREVNENNTSVTLHTKMQKQSREVAGVMKDSAKKAVENVSNQMFEPFTFEYTDAIGTTVADSLLRQRGATEKEISFLQQMRKDISSVANKYAEKVKAKSALDSVANYYANQDAYNEAYRLAKEEVIRRYRDNGIDIPENIQRFLDSSIEDNQKINALLKELGTSISQIAKSNEQTMTTVESLVKERLLNRGFTEEDATSIADRINAEIRKEVEILSQERLNNIFGDNEQTEQRSRFYDRVAELANYGAFDDVAFNRVASEYITGINGITLNPDLARKFVDAKTEEERNSVMDEIIADVADQIPSSLLDKWNSLRYLNMLGNFKTPARNLSGNLFTKELYNIKNSVQTVAEYVANKATSGDIERTRSMFVSKDYLDSVDNYLENNSALQSVLYSDAKYRDGIADKNYFRKEVYNKRNVWKSNGDWGLNENDSFAKKSARAVADTFNKGMSGIEKGVDWIMNNEYFGDKAFLKAEYKRIMAGALKAKGVSIADFNNANWRENNSQLVEKCSQIAIQEAKESTFHDNNAMSNYLSKALRTKDTPFALRILGEGISPFRKTPVNVAMRIEEYSPIGIINAISDAVKASKNEVDINGNDITANNVISDLSKSFTGTALMAIGIALTQAGVLHGKDDKNEKEYYYNKMNGIQDYSIELNGKTYSLDWASPSLAPMFIGSQLWYAVRDNGAYDIGDFFDALTLSTISENMASILDPTVEMSMLQGVNDALETVKYNGNIGDLLSTICANYFTQGLSSTLLGQIERIGEQYRQSTYVDKNNKVIGKNLQKTIGKISSKNPLFDYNQYDYIDAWGRKESNGSLGMRAFENLISPSYISEVATSNIDTELKRIADATGSNSVYPSLAQKYITYNGNTKQLTKDEYVKYATTLGQQRYDLVSSIISSNAYKNLADSEKAEAIEMCYEYANAYAKSQVSDYAPGSWVKKAMASPIGAKDYILMKMKIDADGNGSVSKSEAIDYLDSTNLSTSDKGKMIEIINSSWKNPYTDGNSKSSTKSGSSSSKNESSRYDMDALYKRFAK